jgi:PmbA protein
MIDYTDYTVKKALQLGATDVVVKGCDSDNQQLRFSNNQIDIAKTWYEHFLKVFLVYDKKVVSTEIKNVSTIDDTLKTLIALAKISKENPEYHGIAEGPFTYTGAHADSQLKNVTDVSDFVTAAINKALEHATTTAGILQVTHETISLSTSNSIEAQDEKTSIELSLRAFSQKEASGHGVSCSPTLKGFNPEKAGQEAGELAALAQDPVPGKEGVYDIVFSPLFMGSVLNYSIEMASAFNMLAGRSMYVEKVGEPVASVLVTVVDTPSGLEQRQFDDEGVPTQETTIIDKGVLKTYLHNTSTAAKMHTQTTANAGVVTPEPFNISMDPGDYTKEELFQEVDCGLYLTNTWYTRFQSMQTGDFSTIPRDAILEIENGEITGSLKNIRVSDNMLQLYNNVTAVSKEQRLVRWWAEVAYPCITPYVLVKDVHISRSSE